MTLANQDRRISRTRQLLGQAYIDLFERNASHGSEKQITVKELCAEANINRSTFYAHYMSVIDLRENVHANFFCELGELIYNRSADDIEKNGCSILVELFSYYGATPHLSLKLLNKRCEDSNETIVHQLLYRRFTNEWFTLIEKDVRDADDKNVRILYMTGLYVQAFMGVLTTWIQGGKKERPEAVVKLLLSIIDNSTAISPTDDT